jgi:hypothetical protein
MAKMDSDFRTRLQQHPEDTVRLIVRIRGDMQQAIARLEDLNVTVRRTFTIIPAIAASCKATTALALSQEPWVEAVEEDRQVFHQARDITSANS